MAFKSVLVPERSARSPDRLNNAVNAKSVCPHALPVLEPQELQEANMCVVER